MNLLNISFLALLSMVLLIGLDSVSGSNIRSRSRADSRRVRSRRVASAQRNPETEWREKKSVDDDDLLHKMVDRDYGFLIQSGGGGTVQESQPWSDPYYNHPQSSSSSSSGRMSFAPDASYDLSAYYYYEEGESEEEGERKKEIRRKRKLLKTENLW